MSGIHLVVDEKGVFRDANFAKAIAVLEEDLDLSKDEDAILSLSVKPLGFFAN